MARWAWIGSWTRLGVQAGLLAGLGLALLGGRQRPVHAGVDCTVQAPCGTKKPNLLFVLDHSSSMNAELAPGQTGWEAAVEAIANVVTTDAGYIDQNMHLALMRFGHDPDPANPGSAIAGTGLVDGTSLDVGWYDPALDPQGYFECNGQVIVDALGALPPPICNPGGPPPSGCAGVGSWTNGALMAAQSMIAQTRLDHPDDLAPGDERAYAIVLLTDGAWTGAAGSSQPADQDPAPTAAALFDDAVSTYVVAFGSAFGAPFADEIAAAGGTAAAIHAGPGQIAPAVEAITSDFASATLGSVCASGPPRVMVILDASSSMLNVMGAAGAMGTTPWDRVRDALAGGGSIFDAPLGSAGQRAEDVVQLGLVVFGDATPAEDRLLVDYGACQQDNVAWALDPATSCAAGCLDPWGGPPIEWTFVGPGDAAYPGFDEATHSHMPQCDGGGAAGECVGSGAHMHLGLSRADLAYHDVVASPPPFAPIDANTVFANILITDGPYDSTDAQVEAALTHMHGGDGIITYVIAFGDDVSSQALDAMACWGSGGAGMPCTGGTIDAFAAANQGELEAALQTVLESIEIDPCCASAQCLSAGGSDGGSSESTSTTTEGPSTGTSEGSEAGSGPGVVDSSGGVDATGSGGGGPDGTAGPMSSSTTPSGDASAGPPDTDTGTDTDTDGPGAVTIGGCGCSTDRRAPKVGWLALLTMMIAAGIRPRSRRRRATTRPVA